MRMMDNCSLETDSVKTIQDDLNYYVESNEEPDFAENEMMYEDLELEESAITNIYPAAGNWGVLSLTSLSPPPLPSLPLHTHIHM
jgi:CCR4-NOT transcription complex subunit 3